MIFAYKNELVSVFLRLQDKAKPAVRRGRKATGLNVLRTIVFL